MYYIVKHFSDLTTRELYELLKLRVNVFVVEQNCPYPELDDKDLNAYHVLGCEDSKLVAYLRVLDKGVSFEHVSIGRVVSVNRNKGYGRQILKKGIRVAKEKYEPDIIEIEAQTYAKEFYEKEGFVQTSEEFLEDGIPHIKMELKIK